jgi:hypothetical protein
MPPAATDTSSKEDPQIVIERLAQGRISQSAADRYFLEIIEKTQEKSILRLLFEAVKSIFPSRRIR